MASDVRRTAKARRFLGLLSCFAVPVLLALLSMDAAAARGQAAAAPSAPGQPPAASSVAPAVPPAAAGQPDAGTSKVPDWQVAAGSHMEFDVASVKPDTADMSAATVHANIPLGPMDAFTPTGGLFSAANFPLLQYILFAYKMNPTQIQSAMSQLPKWATSTRYDIEARASGNPTKDQFRLMVQSLLVDRFKLAIHFESKQTSVLALVLDKPGKLGPHLQQYKSDEPPCTPANPGDAGPPPNIPGGFPVQCGVIGGGLSTTSPGQLHIGARNISMTMIAGIFSAQGLTGFDKPVIDGTGLGMVDFAMDFSPNLPPGANFQADPNGPTFLEALKEQLGLKVESQTGAVDSVVIDHIEQPTEN